MARRRPRDRRHPRGPAQGPRVRGVHADPAAGDHPQEPAAHGRAREGDNHAMKLYGFPPTCSIRVVWMLRELDVEFELATIDPTKGEHRQPEFLALNPAGKLPVLVDGDFILTESVAIVLYLAEKYLEKGLLPAELRARADVYRWLLFSTT